MGRPRQYASGAERQRAFRARLEGEWPRVNGRALSRLNERLNQLQAAVWAAAAAGDETARACSAASLETVLDRVIQQFEARAKALKEKAADRVPAQQVVES
jgi:hypothetical protein